MYMADLDYTLERKEDGTATGTWTPDTRQVQVDGTVSFSSSNGPVLLQFTDESPFDDFPGKATSLKGGNTKDLVAKKAGKFKFHCGLLIDGKETPLPDVVGGDFEVTGSRH